MTKEWQEASNEILKVSHPTCLLIPTRTSSNSLYEYKILTQVLPSHRSKKPIPSPVSRPRATRVPDRSSLLPRVLKRRISILRKQDKTP